MSPRVWRHRIADILDAIKKIQQYVEGMDFGTFQEDARTIDAVVRNFIVIGEAAGNVPEKSPQATHLSRGGLWRTCEISLSTSIGVWNSAHSGKP
jgi:uncharacterized protein with HEPN domain